MTTPLPEISADPAIAAGHAAKARFLQQAATIRASAAHSDSHKAAQVAAAWQETLAELVRQRDDFNNRRQARWDHLQKQIPTGPPVPENASAVEKAQLLQLFQAAVEKARAASPEEAARMYADARRFGDDLTARAFFVVGRSEGRHAPIVQRYVDDHPEVAATLAELQQLQSPTGRGFIGQALGVGATFTEPPEVAIAARNEQLARNGG